MSRERLQLALERLQSEHWKLFEEFASAFLVAVYPNLRTTASNTGDKGRDAEIFSLEGNISVVLQYSVTTNWKRKICETAQTVSQNLPDARVLIYVTNQTILSAADQVRKELLSKFGIVLDIHDQGWFLDRYSLDDSHLIASENLAEKIVDPLLSSKKILEHSAPTLTSLEYQAALTFLQLQLEDDTRAKGLTRLSFEALVRTVLRDTNSESRLSRKKIHKQMIKILSGQNQQRIKVFADSALGRLSKRYIRYWTKEDEFCLTYDEIRRVKERLAAIEVANTRLDNIIIAELNEYEYAARNIELFCKLTRAVINNFGSCLAEGVLAEVA